MSVTIRIKKSRIHIFAFFIEIEIRLQGSRKAAIGSLYHQYPGFTFSTANIDVIQTVTVHIRNGRFGASCGKRVRNKVLDIKIIEFIFFMPPWISH